MTGPSHVLLKRIERTMLVVGLALGLWAAFVMGQNWYYAHVPVPDSPAVRQLPGEDAGTPVGTSARRGARIERGSWLARLEAPSVRLTATVLEGSDDRTLRRAAGHIEYTPRPGKPGNVGIAGHRDTTFRALRDVKVGDPLLLTTADRTFEYRVSRTWIVEPAELAVLDPTERPTLTLVTCYPFSFIGSAPKRYIVRADLVSERPRG
jgi:LPXTG-site transpeptidase (sortase) family protein